MSVIRAFRSYWLVAGVVAVAGLLFVGAGQSQQPGNKAAKAEIKVKEAVALQDAYIMMAGANHDYDGHRVEAMKRVEEAVKRLDRSVMKNGANGQKVVATTEDIAAARAKFVEKQQGKVHEGQELADLQMREAHHMITKVREAAALQKQPKVRDHVDEAIKHVEIALKIR